MENSEHQDYPTYYWKSCNMIGKHTEITEVNLSAFVYRLFHEDFSSIDGIIKPLSTLPRVIPEQI